MSRAAGIRWLLFNSIGVVALVILNLVVASPAHPTPLPETNSPLARIGALVGQVQIRKINEPDWKPAQFAQELSQGDRIRTSLFSEATLHLRGSSSVVVSADTEFVIGMDVLTRSSFELGVGQITAGLAVEDKREYEFKSQGSDAVATARQGEFNLSTDGKGAVQVDALQGELQLSAKGQKVLVNKGHRSTVLPAQTPSAIMPIPTSLGLKVSWPPTKSDRTTAVVTGKTVPVARVLINGVMARANAEGTFSVEVPLREGANKLVVSATDSTGNTISQESPEIVVDTKPPHLKVDAEGLWK